LFRNVAIMSSFQVEQLAGLGNDKNLGIRVHVQSCIMRNCGAEFKLKKLAKRLGGITEPQLHVLFKDEGVIEKIVCPCNVPGKHWFVVVVYPKRRIMVLYDSYGMNFAKSQRYYVSSIFTFFHLVARKTNQEENHFRTSTWKFYNCSEQLPKQTEGVDCALFSLGFIDHLLHNEMPTFTDSDMPFLRETVALSLHYREPRRLVVPNRES
jgi:hypothetical protein